jgi:hypothetical protein
MLETESHEPPSHELRSHEPPSRVPDANPIQVRSTPNVRVNHTETSPTAGDGVGAATAAAAKSHARRA